MEGTTLILYVSFDLSHVDIMLASTTIGSFTYKGSIYIKKGNGDPKLKLNLQQTRNRLKDFYLIDGTNQITLSNEKLEKHIKFN